MSERPEGDAPKSAAPRPSADSSPPSAMSRRLQRFGPPDLEVTVGKGERMYRYHSLILASHSLYVDTLLSTPAAQLEQEKWRISFPDIKVETWEKMMKFLSPTADNLSMEDMIELIPHYDQYQFQDALRYIDNLLVPLIPGDHQSETMRFMSFSNKGFEELLEVSCMIFPLNSFPRSKPLIIGWAKRCLKRFDHIDEEMFRSLLPMVENDNGVMETIISTYLGKKRSGLTMNQMRDLVKAPDFPEKCILRCKQIKELDEQRSRLHVAKLHIHSHCEEVEGEYKYCKSPKFAKEYGSECEVCHAGGAMRGYWRKVKRTLFGAGEERTSEIIVVEAVDVYGSGWEVYGLPPTSRIDDQLKFDEAGIEEENKRVFLRWGNGFSNSLVPPKHGWKVIDDSGNVVANKIGLAEYSFD